LLLNNSVQTESVAQGKQMLHCMRYSQNTNGRRNSYQTYWYDSSTVSNQTQRNCNCTIRLTRSLLLPTQAYTVRLVWVPGHIGNVENVVWKIWTFAERGLHNVYT